MEYLPNESKPDYYKTYQHENGKKYIVLKGLDPKDVHSTGALEQFAHRHYDQIATLYWVLMAGTFLYLIINYILLPLTHRLKKISN